MHGIILWIGVLVLSSFLAGVVPALTISRYRPIQVLKGKFSSSLSGRWLRMALVVSQFVLSISLITGTLIVQRQMNFLRNQKLGFEKEQVLVINQASALKGQGDLFLQKLHEQSWVRSASAAQYLPGDEFDSMGFIPEQPANFERTSINYNFVDDRFLDVLGIRLSAGRNFESTRRADSLAFIINGKAANMLDGMIP